MSHTKEGECKEKHFFFAFPSFFCTFVPSFLSVATMNKNGTKKRHHLMRLVAGLPLGILYLLSDIAFPIIYYIIRYRRRLVRENLRCSFPEKNEEEIISIEKKFYHNLCDVFIEAFKCLNISDEEMRRRVEVLNCELPERIASEGKNVFMLLGHCGCWEWCQEVCMRYKNPKKNGEIYLHIKNSYFASLMHEIRSRWNTTQIETKQTVRTLLKWYSEGEPFLCGFIQDQRAITQSKDSIIFMSQGIGYLPGSEELGVKINAAFVYLDIKRTFRGHYQLTFTDIIPNEKEQTSPYPISHAYWRLLETTIRRQPEIWLWSHNRWGKWYTNEPIIVRMKNLLKNLTLKTS